MGLGLFWRSEVVDHYNHDRGPSWLRRSKTSDLPKSSLPPLTNHILNCFDPLNDLFFIRLYHFGAILDLSGRNPTGGVKLTPSQFRPNFRVQKAYILPILEKFPIVSSSWGRITVSNISKSLFEIHFFYFFRILGL